MTEIVNISQHNAIGCQGALLMHFKEDMAFFRQTTKHKVCLMGRRTLESFPNRAPLRDRVNIVLTGDLSRIPPESVRAAEEDRAAGRSTELIPVRSEEEALAVLRRYPREDIYIIGGETVYRQFLPYTDTCLVTENDAEVPEADAFFPVLDPDTWVLTERSEPKEENGVHFRFCTYKRKGAPRDL